MEKPDFRDYPNSPEGLAAYDAALEKFERVQKGPMIGTGFADTVEDVVQSAGEQISKIPGVNIGLQYLGGTVRTFDQVMSQDQGPGGMVYRTYQNVRSAAEKGFGDLVESVGVDRRYGEFGGGELVDTLATAGLGSVAKKAATVVDTLPPGGLSPQLAVAGNMAAPAQLTPQITKGGVVMKAVTINNPKALETTGRKLGEEIIEKDPVLAKHLAERSVNMQRLENKIDRGLELQKLYKKDLSKRPEYKTAQRQVKKGRPALYSETSNVKPFTEQDPQQYGISTKATKQVKEDWIKERVEKNLTISEKIHEHHLVTKGGTAAAFRKMEDFIKKDKAHPDDLVVMFEYAEKKGVAPGDRLSNIAMIQDTPHSELHKQVLIPAGDEFKQAQWDKILKELKTPEDLMDWWVDQVDNNYVPNKNTGLIWQDLDDLIKEVRSTK